MASVDLPVIKRVHDAWKANDEELVRHWGPDQPRLPGDFGTKG